MTNNLKNKINRILYASHKGYCINSKTESGIKVYILREIKTGKQILITSNLKRLKEELKTK